MPYVNDRLVELLESSPGSVPDLEAAMDQLLKDEYFYTVRRRFEDDTAHGPYLLENENLLVVCPSVQAADELFGTTDGKANGIEAVACMSGEMLLTYVRELGASGVDFVAGQHQFTLSADQLAAAASGRSQSVFDRFDRLLKEQTVYENVPLSKLIERCLSELGVQSASDDLARAFSGYVYVLASAEMTPTPLPSPFVFSGTGKRFFAVAPSVECLFLLAEANDLRPGEDAEIFFATGGAAIELAKIVDAEGVLLVGATGVVEHRDFAGLADQVDSVRSAFVQLGPGSAAINHLDRSVPSPPNL